LSTNGGLALLITVLLFTTALADTCDVYGEAAALAEVDEKTLTESSGIVRSRSREGVWFTHNDAGGSAELFSFQLDGTFLEVHTVEGAGFRDWEDIAAGPCPQDDSRPCLYIGDIGDNSRNRDDVTVYVVEEPGLGASAEVVATWTATYPSDPENSEALMVHPCTGRIYLVTKTSDSTSFVYRFPEAKKGELELVAEIGFGEWEKNDPLTTGADWEEGGDRLVVRTYGRAWEWTTDPLDPDAHWADVPTEIALVDSGIAEGVGYDEDGSIITSIEGVPMVLNRVPCEAETETSGCEVPDTGDPDSGTGDSGTGDSGTGDSGTGDSGTGDDGTADSGTFDDGGTGGALPTGSSSPEKCGCGGGGAWLLVPLFGYWRRRSGPVHGQGGRDDNNDGSEHRIRLTSGLDERTLW
jgi:hypothetical protein